MADLYGMQLAPLPLGTSPLLPLAGQEGADRAQYPGPSPDAAALYTKMQADQAAQTAQATQTAAATTQRQGAASQFMDWPTYLQNRGGDPAEAYDDYLNTAAPDMWKAAGLPPEQVQEAQALFSQQVPKPASVPQPAQGGVLGNAGTAISQASQQTLGAMRAGAAVAAGSSEGLANLAKQQAVSEAQTPANLKKWQKSGGIIWNSLGQTYKNVVGNPEGAMDAALQTLTSFVPFIAAGTVGSLGGPVGIAASMGLTAADLAAGSVALNHIRQGLADDKVDVNNAPAVKAWIEANGSKVFGDAWKSAGTEGAVTALTMGVAGKMGTMVAKGLADATPGMGKLAAAKIATEVGGLGASSVAGAVAAGDTPNANDVISQSLAMLIPSLFHAHAQFKEARTVGVTPKPEEAPPPAAPPSTKETLGDEAAFPKEPPAEPPAAAATPPAETPAHGEAEPEPFTTEELNDRYQQMVQTKLDDEAAVRAAVGLPEKNKAGGLKKSALADEAKAVAEAATPEDKATALEALAAAADKKGKADVVERAQAEADRLRALEPPTEDEVVEKATAIHVAQNLIQEVVNEHAQEVAATVKQEIEERKQPADTTADTGEAAAPAGDGTLPTAAAIPPAGGRTATGKRKAGLKQNPPVLEGAGGAATNGPADRAGANVNQEGAVQTAAPVPERGGPAGVAGVGGEPTAVRPNRKNGLKQRQGPNEPNDVRVKERSDAFYVRRMIDEMGFDPETAKSLYNDDPAHWREQVEEETTKGRVEKPLSKEDVESAVKAQDEGAGAPVRLQVREASRELFANGTDVPVTPEFAELLRTGRMTSVNALNYLSGRSESLLVRTLARQLQQVLGHVAIPIRVVDDLRHQGRSVVGQYRALTNDDGSRYLHRDVQLHGTKGLNENTILHELSHAASLRALDTPRTPMQRMFAERFKDIYDQAKRAGVPEEHYGMTNPVEFLAESWSNPRFQRILDRIPYKEPVQLRNLRLPTLWAAFKDSIAKLFTERFGLKAADSEKMSLLQAAITHSADLFDTHSEVNKQFTDADIRRLTAKSASREKETEDAFAKTPHDAILGVDKDGERTHIAYRNDKDNTYNLYDVTPEEPKGDPETKRVGLSGDAVRQAIGENGGQPLERSGDDFRSEPKNTRTELNGWDQGARKFAAFKQSDGTWNVYKGDDLNETKPLPQKFKDYDAVQAEYRKGNYLKTEAQDAARQRDLAPKDLMVYRGPSRTNVHWWDADAPKKYLGQQAAEQFKDLPEYMRPDLNSTLMHSFVNRDVRNFLRDESDPLVKQMRGILRKYGKTGDDFDRDSAALHYEERGKAKLNNPGMADLPDLRKKVTANLDAARAHVATLDPQYKRELQDAMRKLKKISDKTLDEKVRFGMLTPEKAAAIKAAYEFYVPLTPESMEKVSGVKRATGTTSTTTDPVQQIIDQRRSTIIQGYDNLTKLSVKKLAEAKNIVHPDGSKLFEIGPILKYGFDKDGNLDRILDPLVMDKRAIWGMEDGKPYRMLVNDEDFQKSMQAKTPGEYSFAVNAMANFNAIYAALKTQLSLPFAVSNLIRDTGTILGQVDKRVSPISYLAHMKNPSTWMAALADSFEVGHRKQGGSANQYAQLAAKVRDAGGFIDRRSMYGYDHVVEDVRANIDPNWLDHLGEAQRKLFDFEHGAVYKVVTAWTKTMENANRIAVFQAAKDAGLSDNEAGYAAKTASVNFEPKGSNTSSAGLTRAFYVFANAKLQGTRTYAERMGVTGLKGGANARERFALGNSRTQAITGLGTFIGMLAAMYGYNTSDKNPDTGRTTYGELSDYQKDDFFTLKSGGVSVPLPPEFSWSYIMGQALVDAYKSDRWPTQAMRTQKAATRFGTGVAQVFWPMGTSMSDPISYSNGGSINYWMQLLLPTPLRMAYDVAANNSTWGQPIVTNQRKGVPLWATNREAAPNAAQVAEWVHKNIGLDAAPQNYAYLGNQMFGPQLQQYQAIFGAPEATATGTPKQNVFERRFMQTASPLTSKNDLQEIHDRAIANSYDPTKKKQSSAELLLLDRMDRQVSALYRGFANMSEERKQQVTKQVQVIRGQTLQEYNRRFGDLQTEGQ